MTASQPPADNELREALAEVMAEAAGAIWIRLGPPTQARFRAQADAALAVVAAHASQQQAAIGWAVLDVEGWARDSYGARSAAYRRAADHLRAALAGGS